MTELPGAPHEHMDALMRFLLPAARREVDRAGGFLPFGASMAHDGEVALLTASDPAGTEAQQLDQIRSAARASATHLLAVGVCSDVTVSRGSYPEAIRIELEHRDANPITWLLPYRNTDEELAWGERVSVPGERHTWKD